MKKRILETVEDVVEAFGGTTEAAKWAGVGPSAVSNWIAKGFVPPGWHFRMSDYFRERGHVLSRSVFGEDSERPLETKRVEARA